MGNALGYVCAVVAAGGAVAVAAAVVQRYRDRRLPHTLLPAAVAGTCIALALCLPALLAADIASVSAHDTTADAADAAEYFAEGAAAAVHRWAAYVASGLLLAAVVLAAPLAYFYAEEDAEEGARLRRLFGALRYVGFPLLLLAALALVGFFVHVGDGGASADLPWLIALAGTSSRGVVALGFVVGVLAVAGYSVFTTYAAYGLSALPLRLIRGRRHIAEEQTAVAVELAEVRHERGLLDAKAAAGAPVSQRDEHAMNLLTQKERVAKEHAQRLNGRSQGRCEPLLGALRPCGIVGGVLLALAALVLVVAVAVAQVDRFLHSPCGHACGYLLPHAQLPNLLDLALVGLAQYFPLDLFALIALALLVFFATLRAVRALSIRFFCLHLFDVRPHNTAPQGLVLFAILLSFSSVAAHATLIAAAPRYTAFGTQTYANATHADIPCAFDAPPGTCALSQTARFWHATTSTNYAFLGTILYYGTWLFAVCWIVGAVFAFLRPKDNNVSVTQEELDDIDLDGPL